jgi:tRNA pseudouridine55 synthase
VSDLSWLEKFHGFLLIDKPEGITSQDVITQMQRALITCSGGKLRKRELPSMGHGGTLDPFATGLLVVAVGDGVKLTRYLLGSEKSYEADIAFGARTASGDLTNEVVERTDTLPSDLAALEKAARGFLETPYLQTPPMYSAKKIDGIPLYEHARKGLEVDRAVVSCKVREFSVVSAASGVSSARIRTRVTAGTYIRTLAEDFASRMGSLAHLTSLRRLASGVLTLEKALPLDQIVSSFSEGKNGNELGCFIPFHHSLSGILPRMEVDLATAKRIFSGETRTLAELPLIHAGSVALYCQNHLVAIVRDAEGATPRSIERAFPLRFAD